MMKKRIFGLLASCTIFSSAQASISADDIDLAAAKVQPQVVEWRRWFHQNPELSNREFNTAKRISEILRNMGLEPRTGIAHTGITAVIKGGLPGPLVALRADMDGLPVAEQTGLAFASTARSEYNGQDVGVMHACGHDAHMAMVLGAAKVLNDRKAELTGSVMLIFQPAEEGPPAGEDGGASMMLDEGIFKEQVPAAVFGIHVGIGIPGGRFAVKPGPMMAAADRYQITVKGKQTHGARPWDGVDPIVLSAQIVMALQTVASRQVDVTAAPSIISVGRINGGIRNNVIPDQVELEGTIRTFDPKMRDYIHMAVERTARSIAASAGAEIEFELEKGPPPLRNDADLTAQIMPALERASGQPALSLQPQTVAEDFSEYGDVTPAVFVFLGNWPADLDPGTQPANHSPYFDMHEPYLENGVKAFSHMVLDFLQSQ
ncbi:MAG: amidohydrolase [Gammaproteobacteria bacterium]|nr:amidohydrolase [Gammaproteobacteria bacterium]